MSLVDVVPKPAPHVELERDLCRRARRVLVASAHVAADADVAQALERAAAGDPSRLEPIVRASAADAAYFVVAAVERLVARRGGDLAKLAPLVAALPPGNDEIRRSMHPAFVAGWSRDLGDGADPARAAILAGAPRAVDLAHGERTVARALALADAGDEGPGEAEAEAAVAALVPELRVARARGFAELARRRTAPNDKDRARLWKAALDAATKGKQVQDGGEEALALAAVVRALAESGAPADGAEVEKAFAALAKLGAKRAPKDVRSYGLRDAALAAAGHAARSGDRAWLARAASLRPLVHSDHLAWATTLALATAERALGDVDAAARLLAEIPGAARPAEIEALLVEKPDAVLRFWDSSREDLDVAEALASAGRDPSGPLARAVAAAPKQNHALAFIRLYAALRGFDRAAAHALHAGLGIHDALRGSLLAAELLLAAGRTDDATAEVSLAFDLGWIPGSADADRAALLSAAQLRELEARLGLRTVPWIRITDHGLLAALHFARGADDDALRVVALALATPRRDPGAAVPPPNEPPRTPPRSLEAVLAAWRDELPDLDRAHAQVDELARALKAEGSAAAQALAMLAWDHRPR